MHPTGMHSCSVYYYFDAGSIVKRSDQLEFFMH